ncbi:MAG: GxxExxY protein [Proteobacteria bacterium]|nr:GxxExxY protein [Pseudomonadota bacterium]NIS68557.1 GxxExxY protein [Pseudomonadota bacterium]
MRSKNHEDKPLVYKDLTHKIIGAALEVYKILGYGFIEEVYEKALLKEFDLRGIPAKSNCRIRVSYKGDSIPCYLPNILVDDKVIVDLLAEEEYDPRHESQVINYLKATGIKVGLIINFGRDGCKPRRFAS